MTTLDAQILAVLRLPDRWTAASIAGRILADTGRSIPAERIQRRLHAMDDDGRVLMRNGFYRLSEAERKRA